MVHGSAVAGPSMWRCVYSSFPLIHLRNLSSIVVPAAGYIKSQAYVPWSMSRYATTFHDMSQPYAHRSFSHFIDPFLRAILETSLTPDDNDLFVSNLVGIPILAVHG